MEDWSRVFDISVQAGRRGTGRPVQGAGRAAPPGRTGAACAWAQSASRGAGGALRSDLRRYGWWQMWHVEDVSGVDVGPPLRCLGNRAAAGRTGRALRGLAADIGQQGCTPVGSPSCLMIV